MQVTVGWKGLEGAIKALRGIEPQVARGMSRAIRASTNKTRSNVRKDAPRKARGPHRVQAGVRGNVSGRGIDTVGKVYLKGVAIPVATGSSAHTITPKRAKALHFGDQFAMSANIPAQAPNDFFKRGVDESIPAIEAELDKVGQDILSFVGSTIDSDR